MKAKSSSYEYPTLKNFMNAIRDILDLDPLEGRAVKTDQERFYVPPASLPSCMPSGRRKGAP